MSEKDIRILEKAVKSAYKLHKNIETLDFQLEKFNKFEQKISSFKLKSMITMGVTGLAVGAIIGFISTQNWQF